MQSPTVAEWRSDDNVFPLLLSGVLRHHSVTTAVPLTLTISMPLF
jgi:hypothetical protein